MSDNDRANIHVTNSADSGPGSLREALLVEGPKHVVFDGNYRIRLRSPLPGAGPKTTIDGRGRKVSLTQDFKGAWVNPPNIHALRIIAGRRIPMALDWRAHRDNYYRALRAYLRGDVTMAEVDQVYNVWQEQLTMRGLA